jgi:phosphopantothenoylcysteine decarboxylase/phosphopantothenate--cysteine ligase
MDPQGQHDAAGSAEDLAGAGTSGSLRHPRLLVTAGPTHEPIDEVRYLGNRSTGRVGVEIALAAARRDWPTTVLLGPVSDLAGLAIAPPSASAAGPSDGGAARSPTGIADLDAIELVRFVTAQDLETQLAIHGPESDLLVMAAAVADHRPAKVHPGKLRREGGPLSLELEPVPDLVGEFAARRRVVCGRRRPFIVAFALEPASSLETSARAKLARKGVDAIVANPIETLASDGIDATLIAADGASSRPDPIGRRVSKRVFAEWLLDQVAIAVSEAPPPFNP